MRYLQETGDFEFLQEPIAFLNESTLQPDPDNTGTVYDHACRAVRSVYNTTGHHGLCAIGYGDWNDALSGIGGQNGASIWLSCACVHASNLMASLAKHLNRDDDYTEFTDMSQTMTARINEHAWDGQWYIYAINNRGVPIGSSSSDEGKIHLNVNTWALFTGVAKAAGREDIVWKSIEQLATPVGHMLLKPPYTQASRDNVGRIADQIPGMFENGSIYSHGESFYLYALIRHGMVDHWYHEICKTLPSNQVPDISTGPGHQQSNYFIGPDHTDFGANLFSNFTGSVPWYRRGIELALGVTPEFTGLRIAPNPPKNWDVYEVLRNFRGARIHIRCHKGEQQRITFDGRDCEELIPADRFQAGKEHVVDVTYAAR